jgi:hypothetical protein
MRSRITQRQSDARSKISKRCSEGATAIRSNQPIHLMSALFHDWLSGNARHAIAISLAPDITVCEYQHIWNKRTALILKGVFGAEIRCRIDARFSVIQLELIGQVRSQAFGIAR